MITTPLNDELINSVKSIGVEAGSAIMDVYHTDYDIQIKTDNSPVTEADKKANTIISNKLNQLTPDIPILSEEGRNIPFSERENWTSFWLIDPLDGTKEFIKKNDEFTVNIALIENGKPIFGVVYAPAMDILYWGEVGEGAYKKSGDSAEVKINILDELNSPVLVAGSRSHPSERMNAFMGQFKESQVRPMGSSLKVCLVADGSVHFYPRLGPTMEWDTAAAHAVLRAAEGEMMKYGTNEPLEYNKRNLLNPEFIAGNMHNIQSLKRETVFDGNNNSA